MIEKLKEKVLSTNEKVKQLNQVLQSLQTETNKTREAALTKVGELNSYTKLLEEEGIDIVEWIQSVQEPQPETNLDPPAEEVLTKETPKLKLEKSAGQTKKKNS